MTVPAFRVISCPEFAWLCPRCRMVREMLEPGPAPWCRHGDPWIPADRMWPLPTWHPFHPASKVSRRT